MIRFREGVAVALLLAFGGVTVKPVGQESPFRVGDQQLEKLTTRLLGRSENFRRSMTEAITKSFLNEAELGEYMKNFVKEFGDLSARLMQRNKGHKPVSSDVREVLNRAEHINSFITSYELDQKAHSDWELLRNDLDELAGYYKLKTHWNTPFEQGIPQRINIEALEGRLIGTYKLEKGESGDVNKIVRNALKEMPTSARVRMQLTLMRYLRAPKLIAIERNEGRITFGSSLNAARIYDILGRANISTNERVATLLYGGQFRLNAGSDSDGQYSVTFWSTNLGSRLNVIRTALIKQFRRPIVVNSYYTKISDAADFDLSEEEEPKALGVTNDGGKKKSR